MLFDQIYDAANAKQNLWMKMAKKEEESDENYELSHLKLNQSQSGCCPICSLSYIDDNLKPMTLSPCGHSICEKCSTQYSRCPICGQIINQKAVNYSLLQLSQTISDNGNDRIDFKAEFEKTSLKINDLLNKLDKNAANRKSLNEQLNVNNVVLDHLQNEIHKLQLKKNVLEEKISENQKRKDKAENEYNNLNDIIESLTYNDKIKRLEAVIKE